ncbi:MAG: T9SS type A sorting domain-containing protein [Flavobacteriales bacterium]|jgi:hypothetical protein|nr:T9SS type A sorting domain-containing protein [Flavobacteriales bacterium]
MKKRLLISVLTLIPFLTLAQSDTCLVTTELGISFPPVAQASYRTFAKTYLDDLGVQKIRIGEDWSNREPVQGSFNWGPLEERLLWADSNNYEVLLTIQSNGPNWACSGVSNDRSCVFNDNNDFKNYIDSVLVRYGDKIAKIQFGNEWQSDYWYAGNANAFIQAHNVLYNSVQTNAPNVKVVLGGFTTISLRFLAGCNGWVTHFDDDDGVVYDSVFLANNCSTPAIQEVKARIDSVLKYANYDFIDLHLYDDVEQWDEYYYNFIDTITTPIIVSEFGGPNLNTEPYSDSYQADRLYDYIKKLDSLEIAEAYYFKLVEGTNNQAHLASGLIDDSTLAIKPAYYIFKSFNNCSSYIYTLDLGKRIRFYPNPMYYRTSAEFSEVNFDGEATLNLYDLSGKLVKMITISNNNYCVIDREGLKVGLYYAKIVSNQKVIGRGKLVVQ